MIHISITLCSITIEQRVQTTKMRSHAAGVTDIGYEWGMWDKAVIKVLGILPSLSKNNICFN